MTEDHIQMADRLRIHADIDGIRADPRKIEIAYVPGERLVETLPERLEDWIDEMIEDTVWVREFDRGGAETHKWAGGRNHDPVLPAHEHERGYELKCRLIKAP